MKYWETFKFKNGRLDLSGTPNYKLALNFMNNDINSFTEAIGTYLIKETVDDITFYNDTCDYDVYTDYRSFYTSLGQTWINGEIIISKKSIKTVYNKLPYNYKEVYTMNDLFRFLLHHERGHQLHLYSGNKIPLSPKEILNRDAILYYKMDMEKEQIADSYSIYSLKLTKDKYILLRNSLEVFTKLTILTILPNTELLPNIYSFNKEDLYNNYNKYLNYIKL